MSSLLARAVTINKWQRDPVSFFKDVTGNDPFGHQIDIMNWCKNLENSKLIIVGGTGGGKLVACDTPILTTEGFRTLLDLMIEDQVFGPDGNPTTVTFISDIEFDYPCYELVFSDGSKIIASSDHLWRTMTAKERKNSARRTPEFREKRRKKRRAGAKHLYWENINRTPRCKSPSIGNIRNTKEIHDTLKVGNRINHSIEVCEPIKLPYKSLPIDPYIMGLWLGDGSKSQPYLTIGENEILQEIEDRGYGLTKLKGRLQWKLNDISTGLLRETGVLNNKRIPEDYLMASIEQRKELLRGLMDSDGYADEDCEYTTINPDLANNVYRLIVSLGIKTTICEGDATLNGEYISPKYRIKFLTDIEAFSLPRKLSKQKRTGFRGTHDKRYIIEVNEVDSVPVRCIKVDREDGMFLVGESLISTHNTYALACASLWHVICLPPTLGRPFRVAMAAGGLQQAKRTYDYVMDFANTNKVVSDWIKGEPLKSEIRFKDNSWIAPIPSSDTQLYNLHAECFVVDEAAQAGDRVIMHAPRIVGAYTPNRIIISGHFIDEPECYISSFADIWTNDVSYPRTEWTKIHYSSLDVPWIQNSEVELARKIMTTEQFQAVWLAELPELTSTLYNIRAIREAIIDEVPQPTGRNPVVMAVDWGFGPSAAAIIVAEVMKEKEEPLDTKYDILYATEYPQKTGPWMQKEIDDVAKRYNVSCIRADSSHSQENYRIKQKGWIVEEMVFRALKARMQERLRLLIEKQSISIFRGFDTLLKELVAYRLDSKKDDHLVDCLQMLTWEQPKNFVGDYYFARRKYKQGAGIRR